MKKNIVFVLFLLLVGIFCLTSPASAEITHLYLFPVGQYTYADENGKHQMDVATFIENNRVYVPVRYMAYAIGIPDDGVIWDPATQSVFFVQSNTVVSLTVNSNVMRINGKFLQMDVVPIIRNNRVFIPGRYVVEAFGKTCTWNDELQSVLIGWDDGRSVQAAQQPQIAQEDTAQHFKWNYNDNDYSWDVPSDSALITRLLKYYREKPHPTRSAIDYIATYCMDPDDDGLISTIVSNLKEAASKDDYDKNQTVEFVVAFVQGFPYVSDSVSTGYDEYPRYPEETILEGEGDCEDTAILTATLLRELGYGAALIFLPGHCAVGIKGDPGVEGVYYEVDGVRYYYVETTAKGWPIGVVPDELKGQDAIVLPLP